MWSGSSRKSPSGEQRCKYMTFLEMWEAVWDYWRPNRRDIRKYLIRDGKKHPVAIICPGGGYAMCCSFAEGLPFARELNRRGYHAIVVCYRCKKKARFPAPMDDLAWAVREALDHAKEWNLDMENYSLWGSSAGGHLAASFGTEGMGYAHYSLPKPGAMLLSYPVITMRTVTHAGSRNHLLGKEPTQEEIRSTSVEQQVTEHYPPTFLWYGEEDIMVSPDNSHALYTALQDKNISCELHHYPNTGHGVGLGKGLPCEGWFDRAVAFWERMRESL